MENRLSDATHARLARIAQARGGDPELLAREAIERFVEYDDWFMGEVEKGLASIDRGDLLTREEVGRRLEDLIRKEQSRV